MKCKQVREMMGAYLYGDLTPEEMREVRVHAQDCVLCREDLATRGKVISSLGDVAPTLSELDRERIAWSVKGAIGRKQAQRKPLIFRLAPGLALAGVLLVGIGLGHVATMRSAGLQAKATNEPRKAHPLPQAKISVREVTPHAGKNSQSADKVATQVIDLLSRAVANQTMPSTESPSSRHLGSRRNKPPQDDQVKMAPEGPNSGTNGADATVKEQAVDPQNSTATPKDSGGNAPKSGTTSTDATKLPRVNDPKNAETTPSNP